MTPYHVARGTMRILFLIFMAVLVFAMFYERRSSEFSITVYVLGGYWEKGLNLFSVVSILLFIFCVYVSVILLDSLLYLISKSTGTKGETICRLLINLVDYVSVLICIYFFFRSLGFDTRALLASLGLLSFASSLGAKDLISNILSGITIVFEGEYQVGDIIEVDGYRGTVLEIGVRTTKIEGKGGNIKIIGNQDMKNVINMTRKNSWYAVEINVPADIKLSELEKVFEEQFPLIGAEIPEILSGPYFSGVTGLGKGLGRALITLTILAECNEADYFKVQRKLNRKIQALLEEHGITVM